VNNDNPTIILGQPDAFAKPSPLERVTEHEAAIIVPAAYDEDTALILDTLRRAQPRPGDPEEVPMFAEFIINRG
jgi:hypothetical protein